MSGRSNADGNLHDCLHARDAALRLFFGEPNVKSTMINAFAAARLLSLTAAGAAAASEALAKSL